jgi:hypothetical protein
MQMRMENKILKKLEKTPRNEGTGGRGGDFRR